MQIGEFFQTYFVDPYLYGTGYNPINTFVLGIALVAAVYAFYEYFVPKFKLKIDADLMLALAPFIIFMAFVRVFADLGYLPILWFRTPTVEILFGIPVFFLVLFLQRKTKNYVSLSLKIGAVLCATQVIFYRIQNPAGLGYIILFFSLSVSAVYLLSRYIPFIRDRLSQYVLYSHMLDATSTFVTLQFFSEHFYEEHVLANVFMSFFGPVGMYLMKLLIILPALYVLYRYKVDKEFSNLVKVIFTVFGLAAGARSAMLLVMSSV